MTFVEVVYSVYHMTFSCHFLKLDKEISFLSDLFFFF